MRTCFRIHFVHSHVWDTMIILEDVNFPHPLCPCCDIMLPWEALNVLYPNTA